MDEAGPETRGAGRLCRQTAGGDLGAVGGHLGLSRAFTV